MSSNTKKNRPFEWASKSQHSHLINDESMKDTLARCSFPSNNEESAKDVLNNSYEIKKYDSRFITNIIAIDGGYTEVTIKKNYPSSKVAFFQFGALEFKLADLENLGNSPFIHPDQMEKFKKLERLKLVLPTKATSLDGLSMIDSVRKSIIEFLNVKRDGKSYMSTLKWLVFHEFKKKGIQEDLSLKEIVFGNLPGRNNKEFKRITIQKEDIDTEGYFTHDDESFNLVDILRFHEVVDEELGASGILGYLTNFIEHVIIVHLIKEIVGLKPLALKRFLFIKDGPLAFFGTTAKLHNDMRELCNLYIEEYSLKLVGLEKSGTFTEHADMITSGANACLKEGSILPLFNTYIYKHILPGPTSKDELEKMNSYGSTSYYSGKIIYRSHSDRTWVLTVPVHHESEIKILNKDSFENLDEILNIIDYLKCDRYADSIVPIALANQLISLANHPSSKILEKFAIQSMQQ